MKGVSRVPLSGFLPSCSRWRCIAKGSWESACVRTLADRVYFGNLAWWRFCDVETIRVYRGAAAGSGAGPKPIAEPIRQAIIEMATANPWYGYKRIAVMCRRAGQAVKDRHAYTVMRQAGLLQRARPREPELYQAARLFELLPQKPNDL